MLVYLRVQWTPSNHAQMIYLWKGKKASQILLYTRWLHITFIRRVWRHQRGNQNPYIEEQTTHCHNGQYWIPGACNCSPGFQFDIKSWLKMGVLHIILKVGHPKNISTQISEQKILMWFLSHNIPKRNKLAEKISQKNPEYMLSYSLPCSCS
jgi:hypothetical protein